MRRIDEGSAGLRFPRLKFAIANKDRLTGGLPIVDGEQIECASTADVSFENYHVMSVARPVLEVGVVAEQIGHQLRLPALARHEVGRRGKVGIMEDEAAVRRSPPAAAVGFPNSVDFAIGQRNPHELGWALARALAKKNGMVVPGDLRNAPR